MLEINGAARSGIPSPHGIAPERAASQQRVAFALQVLLAARSDARNAKDPFDKVNFFTFAVKN